MKIINYAFLIIYLPPTSCYFLSLRSNVLLSNLFVTAWICVLSLKRDTTSRLIYIIFEHPLALINHYHYFSVLYKCVHCSDGCAVSLHCHITFACLCCYYNKLIIKIKFLKL
jgi:hypothetical protein